MIIDEQHCFHHGKSTITSSVVFTNYSSDCLGYGHQVDVIITDFNKVFDTVNNELLIDKLEYLDVGYPINRYFTNVNL